MEVDVNFQQEIIKATTAILSAEKPWFESPFALVGLSSCMALLGSFLTQYSNSRSEKTRHQNQTELIKVESEVKKNINVHNLQLNALKALSEINHAFQPLIHTNPDFDTNDAYAPIVHRMSGLLNSLVEYLRVHSYIIPNDVINKIEEVINICNETHWPATIVNSPDYEATTSEIEAAQLALNNLDNSLNQFKSQLGVIVT